MRVAPTANHGPRRGCAGPSLIVLHYTAMRGGPGPVVALFARDDVEVSAHYVVGEDGTVVAMVPEDRRAWHAGAGRWGAVEDVNSASIGIEICNDGQAPFPAAQMAAVERLLGAVMARHGVPPEGVIAHSDLAPGRKIDPGRRFDWRRLALARLSVWPDAAEAPPADAARFRRDAARFGYTADVAGDVLLDAFRSRFRPWAAGPLAPGDMGRIAALAARWPVAVDRHAPAP